MKSSGIEPSVRAGFPVLILLWALATALAQDDIKRIKIDLAHVEELARRSAAAPYRPESPEGDDAEAMKRLAALKYDAYRAIRFRPEQAVWKSENLNFQMHLFHPGYLFTRPVHINEFTKTHCQRIRFVQDFFDYSRSGVDFSLPPSLGYAGFRLHHPLNRPDCFDEIVVFQGASYYRALGKDNVYGLSSRGIAIDCAVPNVKEEFPEFREFWVGKPEGAARQVTMFALVDSESLSGAYQFDLAPGDPTTVEVRATLFFRKIPGVIGVSPFSSMFWFGENSRQRFDDYRPEVHDSDGLAILSASGECLWRPAGNNPPRIETHDFRLDGIKGFGLVQRDRDFDHYQDLEALYHRRPSVWVEPIGDWGPGTVRLVELPTREELADNLVAYWIPAAPPQPQTPFRVAYRQHWGMMQNPANSANWAIATRSGTHPWAPGVRFMIIDFDGPRLRNLPKDKMPETIVTVANAAPVIVESVRIQRNSFDGTWRASFEVRPANPDAKPADVGPIELRCCLKLGDDYLTETWTCRTEL